MSIERVIDHKDQGLARLITQYRGKPRLAAWTGAYLRQVQLLEDAIWDVLIKRMIDNAVGEQLRVIGRIVGEEPNDDDDATFRIMILARIRINRSRGNTDDVLAVLTQISATGVFFKEYRSACLYIGALAIMDRNPVLIYSKLRETKAAGVKLTLVVPTTNTHALLARSVGAITEASNPLHAAGDATILRATVLSVAGPYALTDGMTLVITIDQLAGFAASIVFRTAMFANIATATAAEVLAAIKAQLAWNFPGIVAVDTGAIRVTSRRKGLTASQVDISGSANAVLSFATTANGTGDVSYGLAADVVTQRSPLAKPNAFNVSPEILSIDPPTDAL